MTKKELIAALANVNDDAVVLFGTKEIQFFGAFATQVYINWDSNEVLIANKHTDATTPVYCELLHEDKRININRQGESPAQYRRI